VLTKDILFGMNILSLAGFLLMGISLTLRRTGNAGVPLSIGMMSVWYFSGCLRVRQNNSVSSALSSPLTAFADFA